MSITMPRPQEDLPQSASTTRIAYIAALLMFLRLSTFAVPSLRDANAPNSPLLGELVCILGIVPHVLMFPVIAALPAPQWAKQAGYGWLVVDMATDIVQLSGVPHLTYLSLKYGGHISAVVWITSASWQAKGAFRIVGLLTALLLGSYSFMAPFGPIFILLLIPTLVLLPLWIALAGRAIARHLEHLSHE